MSIFNLGRLVKSHRFIFKYIKCYEGNNSIGNEGCDFLSRGKWKKLNKLDLCNKMLTKIRIKF